MSEPTNTQLYYPINEEAARRAKEANSFNNYIKGSATAEYRQSVDRAVKIAEQQKASVDPMYHDKIDRLVDTYARKLAENMNNRYNIDARVPSILIAGGSNFPVRKKENQNAARDTNMKEWQHIQGLLGKIRSTGTGGISADDPDAIAKLQSKLEGLEESQEIMKSVNAYYRKNKTLDGCPDLTPVQIEKIKVSMSRNWRTDPKPFESYALSNNNAEIHRVKERIEQLKRHSEAVYVGWEIKGGSVEPNQQDNRLQVFFDSKPDEAIRNELKRNGFRWSPRAGAWQRQLNVNSIYAADRIECIQPITGEKPSELYKAAQAMKKAKQGLNEEVKATLQFFIDSDMEDHGEIRPATLEMIAVQGYEYQNGELAEAPPANDTFTIYQLNDSDQTRDIRFMSFEKLKSSPDSANYNVVYTAPLEIGDTLDSIFMEFNIDMPEDFKGRSLSVSDIVVLNRDGNETAFYVDFMGFKELPDFLYSSSEQTRESNTDGKDIASDEYGAVAATLDKEEKADGKPSVLEQIKSNRQAVPEQDKKIKKNKEEPEI